ncbi:DUF779 domain-containing protein [Aromatoleum aromaticum]|uniref:DUF779 domain-containing protein n=1 Tax=Aromatoleum aromaticum TaxID=551760 RepID=UPI00145992AE|nr:DUF779 domain-containing protein [Aromatoleum aromaticum]NMG53932.1 DUF779 domain-containing protein [Aromatoleum aromaticum]
MTAASPAATRAEVLTGSSGILTGEIAGSCFCIGRAPYEFWQRPPLVIDVVERRRGRFSPEGPEG